MYQKIEAIRLVRQITNCGLKEAKEAVESIVHLVQMSKDDLESRLQTVKQNIAGFHSYIWDSMTIEQAKRLVLMCEERERLIQMLDKFTCTKFHEEDPH